MNKSEELIACLEGEIAKRDGRIAELHNDASYYAARNEELRAILSAKSPAGVDGLKRYEVFPYLDDDVAELDICESDDGTFVKYDDAQAIIDGLRGEVDQQAQRIGELASHLEFAVTLLTVAGLAGNAQVEAMRATMSAGKDSD